MSDTTTELNDQLGQLTSRMDAAVKVLEESKATDSARWEGAEKERQEVGKALTDLTEKISARERDEATDKAVTEWNEMKLSMRAPSKAGVIGSGRAPSTAYAAGDFLSAIVGSKSNDPDIYSAAKATLASLGSCYMDVPAESKATLGLTTTTGGFIIPNNLVDTLSRPVAPVNVYRDLVTVVQGITGTGVDMPYHTAAPARATVIAPGSTKENLNLTYASYSATLYTIARIYDLATRFVRTSAGAAEADVIATLRESIEQGEAYYILSGAGTTEPTGILTALASAAPTYNTTFTASASALSGSIAAGVAKAAGALESRGQKATAVVVNTADYWTMFTQGNDTSGFWAGNAYSLSPDGTARVFGLRLVADRNLAADQMLVGNFKAAKLYVGQDYRVDTSDQAGSRWDQNLIGFRGEEDIAFDARSAVAVGAFEQITNLTA